MPGIEVDALREFVLASVAGASGELDVEKLSGGSSNLTYRVRDAGGGDWVLRRPPVGQLLATAHDMLREARVQRGLATTAVAVPEIVAVCEDPEVIGAPFYMMGFLDGVVYSTRETTAQLTPEQAQAASMALVDVLAATHNVDFAAAGLADLGKPDGYLERQVGRWCKQWDKSKQREVPAVDALASRLRAALPKQGRAGIVHGDFSFNNTLWDRKDPTKLVALLDWEMSTLGDPLADVGMLIAYWGELGELIWSARGGQAHRHAGFPSAEVLLERYSQSSGRSVENVDFYTVLAIFKMAVIIEGAFARQRAGTFVAEASDNDGSMTVAVAKLGLATANASSVPGLRA